MVQDRKKTASQKLRTGKYVPETPRTSKLFLDSEENSNFQEIIEISSPLSEEKNIAAVKKPPVESKVTQQEKTNIQAKALNYPLKSKQQIIKIQNALKIAGFYKGKADGKLGPRTKKAIQTFQRSKKLRPDGIVGKKTWEALEKYI